MNNTALAVKELLEANDIALEDLERAFQLLDRGGIDYCDFYFQKNLNEGFILEEGIVKAGNFSIDCGVGVRAVSGSKSALAYSDEISLPALKKAIQTVKSIGSATQTETEVKISCRKEKPSLYMAQNPIELAKTENKIALLKKIEALARSKSPLVTQVVAYVNASYDTILVTATDGRLAGDVRPLVRMGLSVIVEKNNQREQAHSGGGGRFSLDYFTDDILKQYADEAVDSALRNLEAKASPAGVLPVVLGCGWPGILLHEAVGHGLEGDFNRKGTSVFSDKIGTRIASPGVTVVDDGTIPNRRGSLNIDDEGNPTQRTVLIEDGILKGYIQDETNAKLSGFSITGNARRESFAHLPMPRMTNTFMLGGSLDPQEIIESVRYGIYAKNFGGGQVDITSGKFVFTMSDAWLIENGKVTAPIKGATLIGSGEDALTKIELIGNDLALDPGVGTCGKDGQSVPVGVGMPTLLINGLTVGGTDP